MSSQNLLAQGYEFQRLGLLKEAEDAYKSVLQADPSHRGAALNLGVLRFQKRDFEGAYQLFKELSRKHLQDTDVSFNLARTCYQMDKFSDALTLLDEILQKNPDEFSCLRLKARILKRIGSHVEEQELLLRLLEHKPQDTDLLFDYCNCLIALNKHEAAIVCLRALTDLDSGHRQAWLLMCDCYEFLGQIDKAVIALKRHLLIVGDHPELHRRLGGFQGILQQFVEARNSYSKAFSLENSELKVDSFVDSKSDEESPEIQFQQKILETSSRYLESNNLKSAIHEFEKLHRLYPQAVTVLQELAFIHQSMGEGRRAIGYYQRILRIMPRHLEARMQLIRLTLQFQDALPSEALLQETLDMYPEVPEVLELAGDYWLGRNQEGKARPFFTKALALRPDLSDASLGLGTCHLLEGRAKDAIAVLVKALALHEQNLEIRIRLVEAYLEASNVKSAQQVLRRAPQTFQRLPKFLALQARLYTLLHKVDKARATYKDLASARQVDRECFPDYIKSLISIRDADSATRRLKEFSRFRHKTAQTVYLETLIQVLRRNPHRFSVYWQELWSLNAKAVASKADEIKVLLLPADLEFITTNTASLFRVFARRTDILAQLKTFLDCLQDLSNEAGSEEA